MPGQKHAAQLSLGVFARSAQPLQTLPLHANAHSAGPPTTKCSLFLHAVLGLPHAGAPQAPSEAGPNPHAPQHQLGGAGAETYVRCTNTGTNWPARPSSCPMSAWTTSPARVLGQTESHVGR